VERHAHEVGAGLEERKLGDPAPGHEVVAEARVSGRALAVLEAARRLGRANELGAHEEELGARHVVGAQIDVEDGLAPTARREEEPDHRADHRSTAPHHFQMVSDWSINPSIARREGPPP
jgi:hypothetical protein